MTTFLDLEPCTYFGDEAANVLRAVGWIDRAGFRSGATDAAVYERLVVLLRDPF